MSEAYGGVGWGFPAGSTRNKRSEAHEGSDEKEASKRVWIRVHLFFSRATNLPVFVWSDILWGPEFHDDKAFIGRGNSRVA